VSIEGFAHLPCPFTKNNEGNPNTDQDVEKGKPCETEAIEGADTAESNHRRCAYIGRSITQRHYQGMNLSACEEVIRHCCRLPVAKIAQIDRHSKVNQGKCDEIKHTMEVSRSAQSLLFPNESLLCNHHLSR